MAVTPWEVSGNVDYDKLLEQFGVSKLSPALIKKFVGLTKSGKMHHYLSRGLVFGHRDLNALLDWVASGKQFYLYTGRGPSGGVHIGHVLPWLIVKWLQDEFNVNLVFQLTDDEKFLFDKKLTLDDTIEAAKDNMLDILAVGFNPRKTHFLIDTVHADIMYEHAIQVAKRITFSTAKGVFGFGGDTNIGAIFFTAMQAVPAFLPSAFRDDPLYCLIPHGIDQDPHFRCTRDVLPKLGYMKPASLQWGFLPGLKGIGTKMSSSDPTSTIYMTDSPSVIKKKINKYAFSGGGATLEEHQANGGNPDIDVAFQILRYLEPNDEVLESIAGRYRSGELLTGEMKKLCIEALTSFIVAHQERRAALSDEWQSLLFDSKLVEKW